MTDWSQIQTRWIQIQILFVPGHSTPQRINKNMRPMALCSVHRCSFEQHCDACELGRLTSRKNIFKKAANQPTHLDQLPSKQSLIVCPYTHPLVSDWWLLITNSLHSTTWQNPSLHPWRVLSSSNVQAKLCVDSPSRWTINPMIYHWGGTQNAQGPPWDTIGCSAVWALNFMRLASLASCNITWIFGFLDGCLTQAHLNWNSRCEFHGMVCPCLTVLILRQVDFANLIITKSTKILARRYNQPAALPATEQAEIFTTQQQRMTFIQLHPGC